MANRSLLWSLLKLETLEDRRLLACAGCIQDPLLPAFTNQAQPLVLAGQSLAQSLDSSGRRTDSNSAGRFAGVGSIEVLIPGVGTILGTGTLISSRHVLTAAHLFDLDGDGKSDVSPGGVTFNLNLDIDSPIDDSDVRIGALGLTLHPDYTGFANPAVNDDLAIITLPANAVPAGVPFYAFDQGGLTLSSTITFVGYGRSGSGVTGFTGGASTTVKHFGSNVVDAFLGQDDQGRPSAGEVFLFDFDGTGRYRSLNVIGGGSLGNAIESTLGPGDSGGPSFVVRGDPALASSYFLVGVNTFGAKALQDAPLFGSLGGGIRVQPYLDWINRVSVATTTSSTATVPRVASMFRTPLRSPRATDSEAPGTVVEAILTEIPVLALSLVSTRTAAGSPTLIAPVPSPLTQSGPTRLEIAFGPAPRGSDLVVSRPGRGDRATQKSENEHARCRPAPAQCTMTSFQLEQAPSIIKPTAKQRSTTCTHQFADSPTNVDLSDPANLEALRDECFMSSNWSWIMSLGALVLIGGQLHDRQNDHENVKDLGQE